MGGAGFLTIAAMLCMIPFAALADYKKYFHSLDPRKAALAEASHGAAMIVLPVVFYARYGGYMPSWFPLAMAASMFWGLLRALEGARNSQGFRDPKLITRALIKIALGVSVWVWLDINPYLNFVGWWLVVTGVTKLHLVLRGLPTPTWQKLPPDMVHGAARFSKAKEKGWKL